MYKRTDKQTPLIHIHTHIHTQTLTQIEEIMLNVLVKFEEE